MTVSLDTRSNILEFLPLGAFSRRRSRLASTLLLPPADGYRPTVWEAAMKIQRRFATLFATIAVGLSIAAPPADAGGSFGMHVGSGGFGVSVGFGDWSVYTRSWVDPYWSLDFNATLAGYGEWVWVNGLGRVWRPWVSAGWRPYTHGRWVGTGIGWTWVAYEPWGYVPHHYGNWAYCSFGWVWRPGYTYSRANVVWARSGGYVGWYARPPHGWSHAAHGFRHGYRHGYRDGYSDGWHDARYGTYVDWRHFGSDNVSHHAATHAMASRDRLEDHAAPPSVTEVRRRGGVPVAQTRLSRRTVRMGDREITIARPEGVARSIERNAADAAASALAPAALERRQPLVRSRSADTATGSARRGFSSDHREARSPEVQSRNRVPSSSRSGISATTTVSRTDGRSASNAERPRSAHSNTVGSHSSHRGQAVREVRQDRRTTESRSSTTRGSRRSDRSSSTPTSAEIRRSPEKPRTTGTARRTPQKPRTATSTADRSDDNTVRKSPRRRSTGGTKR